MYRTLVADQARLDQIVGDVLTVSETGANILVLTTLGLTTSTPSPNSFKRPANSSPSSLAA